MSHPDKVQLKDGDLATLMKGGCVKVQGIRGDELWITLEHITKERQIELASSHVRPKPFMGTSLADIGGVEPGRR